MLPKKWEWCATSVPIVVFWQMCLSCVWDWDVTLWDKMHHGSQPTDVGPEKAVEDAKGKQKPKPKPKAKRNIRDPKPKPRVPKKPKRKKKKKGNNWGTTHFWCVVFGIDMVWEVQRLHLQYVFVDVSFYISFDSWKRPMFLLFAWFCEWSNCFHNG